MKVGSTQGRLLIAAMVLASGMAFLDGSIVSLALPAIERELGASVSGLQWTLNAYTLTLAALILVGGSLGDRFGRRRIFLIGVVWFTAASIACAVAPAIEVLIASRAVQGIGGALLTPGSLAIISASIDEEDRGKAIGIWSGLAGVTSAIGPLAGGWIVEHIGWRAVFWINAPLALAVVWLTVRHVPETHGAKEPIDIGGAFLTVAGLSFLTLGLVSSDVLQSVVGVILLAAFVIHQARTRHPLVPLSLFSHRVFAAANICTFAIYGALSGSMFLLVLQLQYVSGYSALRAGLATLPATVLMLLFSGRAGQWGARIGPRIPMTLGPVIAGFGAVLYLRIGSDANFLIDVIPGAMVFGVGLTMLVAPLTASVLASAPGSQTGIASGINNAVARTAGLLTVAAIPPVVGIAGPEFATAAVFSPGFRAGILICAAMLFFAGALAALLIPSAE